MASKSLGVLTLDLVARIGGYTEGLNKAQRETERRSKEMRESWQRVGSAIQSAIGVVSAGAAIREYTRFADSFTNLSSRIRLVTSDSQEFLSVQRDVFEIAQRSRTGFENTADLYTRLARTAGTLGVSQKELLQVTESINQALVISGGSAESANAALIQLGQGFSSGVLRGEELNSVLEQAPRLAQAIATGLGVAVGDLRKLGEQGKLTADAVFKALQSQANSIQNEFNQMPATVGQATQRVSNSILLLVGNVDTATGSSRALTEALSSAAGGISDFADDVKKAASGDEGVGLLAQAFQTAVEASKVFFANVSFVFKGIGREIGAVAAQVVALGTLDIKGFNAISEAVKEDGARARAELDRYEYSVLRRLNSLAGAGRGTAADPRSLGNPGSIADQVGRPKPAGSAGGAKKDPFAEAQRFLESLQKQLLKTQELSVAEVSLAEIRSGRIGKVSAAQEAEILRLSKLIDLEKERQRVQEEAIEIGRQLAMEEGDAIERQNELYQTRLSALLDPTPSRVLQKQREDIQFLTEALEQEFINEQQYLEAVSTRLDLTAEKTEKTKNLAEELGLSFTSAFEDAIVGGKGLSDVLKGLEQDTIRIVTRKLVTEPLGNALTGMLGGGSSGGAGGILGGIGGFLRNLLPFDGGGFTGSGPRAGGLDGKGGFVAMLHPNETVVDHTKGQRMGGIVINQQFAPGTDRQTVNQAALAAGQMIERSQRNA